MSAAKKHYGELADIQVHIDREDGSISGTHDGAPLDPEETIGRIGAQTAKQVMIQKIREAERDRLLPRRPTAGPADPGIVGEGALVACLEIGEHDHHPLQG